MANPTFLAIFHFTWWISFRWFFVSEITGIGVLRLLHFFFCLSVSFGNSLHTGMKFFGGIVGNLSRGFWFFCFVVNLRLRRFQWTGLLWIWWFRFLFGKNLSSRMASCWNENQINQVAIHKHNYINWNTGRKLCEVFMKRIWCLLKR